jgi:hypothetical protein
VFDLPHHAMNSAGSRKFRSPARKRSADHAPASVRGDNEPTIDLDHSVGADQSPTSKNR